MRNLLMGVAASSLATVMGAGMAMAQADSGDLPPNATPGHCYGKLLIPEQYETYTEQVVDRAARTETRIIPAVMGQETKQVVATEAHVEYETIPATYRTVTETVVVRPATTRSVTVPAVYGEETEQVLVREAHTVWKRGTRSPSDVVVPGSTKMLATGEVICLVQVPAEYRTITRQVVRVAETTREVVEPAVTTTVTRTVVDQAARVVERQVPATYKTIQVTTVVQPERTETITIPATYRTVTKQRIVTQSHFEWRLTDCVPEGNGAPSTAGLGYSAPRAEGTSSTVISEAPRTRAYSATYSSTTTTYSGVFSGDTVVRGLQVALEKRGYYHGALNGRFTSATQLAMLRFQRDNNLARGAFTRETAHALGIQGPSSGS